MPHWRCCCEENCDSANPCSICTAASAATPSQITVTIPAQTMVAACRLCDYQIPTYPGERMVLERIGTYSGGTYCLTQRVGSPCRWEYEAAYTEVIARTYFRDGAEGVGSTCPDNATLAVEPGLGLLGIVLQVRDEGGQKYIELEATLDGMDGFWWLFYQKLPVTNSELATFMETGGTIQSDDPSTQDDCGNVDFDFDDFGESFHNDRRVTYPGTTDPLVYWIVTSQATATITPCCVEEEI